MPQLTIDVTPPNNGSVKAAQIEFGYDTSGKVHYSVWAEVTKGVSTKNIDTNASENKDEPISIQYNGKEIGKIPFRALTDIVNNELNRKALSNYVTALMHGETKLGYDAFAKVDKIKTQFEADKKTLENIEQQVQSAKQKLEEALKHKKEAEKAVRRDEEQLEQLGINLDNPNAHLKKPASHKGGMQRH